MPVNRPGGTPVAWLFNLDAEEELALGKAWRRKTELWDRLSDLRRSLAERLGAPGDAFLEEGQRGDGCVGRAWCPTPSALEQLSAAGATPEPAPSLEVLLAVNRKGFVVAELPGLAAPGAALARSEEEALELHRQLGRAARCKRELGAAGRGQLTVPAPDAVGWQDERHRSWLRHSIQRGAVLLEPEVQPLSEWVLHGWIDGAVQVGPPRPQVTSARGTWLSTEDPVPEPSGRMTSGESLSAAAIRVGEALLRAGYFGPFGLDAIEFAPDKMYVSDVNGRYTMGWAHPGGPSASRACPE